MLEGLEDQFSLLKRKLFLEELNTLFDRLIVGSNTYEARSKEFMSCAKYHLDILNCKTMHDIVLHYENNGYETHEAHEFIQIALLELLKKSETNG
jgi:hypothetical protein